MATGNNSGNGSTRLEIGPSTRSQSDIQKFLTVLRNIEKTVSETTAKFNLMGLGLDRSSKTLGEMKAQMQQFKLLSQSIERNSIMQSPGRYFQGQQFQAAQRVERTSRLGTNTGQEIALQKEGLALAKEGARYYRQRNMQQRVFNLDLQATTESFRKIQTIQKARQISEAALVRMGGEVQQGNTAAARASERLHRLAEARVRMLQNEAKVAKDLTRETEKRAAAIRKSALGDRQLEEAKRQERRRMINGDGGASLFMIQASIMANYVAMNALRQSVTGGIEFAGQLDESLRNLQAITVVTDTNLGELKTEILAVSEATKFFATDIADAAVTLGQAGFSTKEIKDSIRAVALLATATGTDLKRSVDLATSILGVFKMESAQMTGVANTLTAAVNNSKLNLDKLALGLQYAGNTAAQSGVSFEELTASLGAMANAGIRSGSTLGTGMRQIMISLQKPSGNFKDTLDRLGISMGDVSLQGNGLYGVMRNLKEGGFTAADAIRSFEVRAAAAFNALSNNLGDVVKLERAFLNSAAAAKANETQMRAVTNQGRRFQANLQALVSTGLEPMVYFLRDVFDWSASLFESWRSAPGVIRGVTTGIVALGTSLLVARTAYLALNVLGIISGFKALKIAILGVATAGAVAGSMIAPLAIAVIGVASALGMAYMAHQSYTDEINRSNDATRRAQTEFDNLTGASEATASQIGMVEDRIKSLTDRSKMLNSENLLLQLEADKVREQFHEMGLELGENVNSVDDLVEALTRLQEKLSGEYVLNLGKSVEGLENLLEAYEKQYKTLMGEGAIGEIINNRGYSEAYRNAGAGAAVEGAQLALTPGASMTDLQNARSMMMNAREADGAHQGLQKHMDQALDQINKMIEIRQTIMSLSHELNDMTRTQADAINRQENPGIVAAAAAMEITNDSRVAEAAATGSGPVAQFTNARSELKTIEGEAEALIEQIKTNEDLNEAVKKDLIQTVENSLTSVRLSVANMGDAAREVAETAAEVADLRSKTAEARIKAEQAKTENPADVRRKGNALLMNLKNQQEAEEAGLLSEFDQETGSSEYQAQLAQIREDYARQREETESETIDHLKRVQDLQIKHDEQQIENLRSQIGETRDPEVRASLREEIAALLNGIAGMRLSQEALASEGDAALRNRMAELDADLSQALKELDEANAEDVTNLRIKTEQIRASAEATRLQLAQSDTEDPDQIRALGADRLTNASRSQSLAEEVLRNKPGQDVSSSIFKAELAALEQEAQEQNRRIEEETEQHLSRVADLNIRSMDIQLQQLERAVDRSGDEDERTQLRDEIVDLVTRRAEALKEQVYLLVDAGIEQDNMIAEIENDLLADLEAIEEANRIDDLAIAQRNTQAAKDALDAVMRLGDDAKTHAENASWYQKVIKAAKNWADALRAEAAIAAEGDGVGDDTAGDADTAIGKLFEGVEDRRDRNASRINRGGRGGGRGGGRNKKDEVDELIENLKAKIGAAESLIAAGEVSNIELDSTLSMAEDKLGVIIGQIGTMQDKLNAGTLTSAEQEKLNELVDQQAKLTSFIAAEEMRIAQIKMEQGRIQEGILMTVQSWARENMSVTQTIQDGVVNVLGNAKGAISTFFTEWANGTKSGKDAFRDMASSVIKSVQNIFAEMMALWVLQKLIGFAFPGAQKSGSFGALARSSVGLREGGDVKKAADGTHVKGNLNRDSQRYDLMPGEYVLRRSAVQAIGVDQLDSLNALGNRTVQSAGHQGAASNQQKTSAPGRDMNIYLVDERSQATGLGPSDVIAVISDDISRGGTTKKLIKSVQIGAV